MLPASSSHPTIREPCIDSIERLLGDDALRARLGQAAAASERGYGGARAMWDAVAAVLDGLPG